MSYAQKNEGDWKQNKKDGAGGFLLVSIEGALYWADAIGQIPFAVDTFKSEFVAAGDKDKAIIRTVKTGINYGDGSILFAKKDNSNNYDNFMILRGALWAAQNHTLTTSRFEVSAGRGESVTRSRNEIRYQFKGLNELRTSIDSLSLSKYGVWRKQ